VTARPTSASSLLRAPECGVKPHRPFLELAALALRLTFRRWPLYAAAILAALAVQAALTLVWHVPHAIDLGGAIAVPLVTALVYAFVSADAGESPVAQSLVWERFLERAWAVIIIDFLLSYVWTAALIYSTSAKPVELLAGLAAFGFSVLAVFADAGAVADDDVTVWTVIPRAFVRSVATAWNGTVFVRALAIVSFALLEFLAQTLLYAALVRVNAWQADFWAQVPLATIVAVPLAALTIVVYRDATGALR
jgi:hypothetical protein